MLDLEFLTFFSQYAEIRSDGVTPTADLHRKYVAYCKANGLPERSPKYVTTACRAAFGPSVRYTTARYNGGARRVLQGVRLRDAPGGVKPTRKQISFIERLEAVADRLERATQ